MGLFTTIRGTLRSAKPENSAPLQPVAGQPTIAPGFAVVDIETSGLSPYQHRVVEIAVVQTDPYGRPSHYWSTRVNPQGPVGATHIHGITEEDVRDAPTFAQLAPALRQLLAGRALVAHNARFDLTFLAQEFGRATWAWPETPTLCTYQEGQYYLPELDRWRLTDCCLACGVSLRDAHSALGDALATSQLLSAYLNPSWGRPPLRHHVELPQRAWGLPWPATPGEVVPGSRIHVARESVRVRYTTLTPVKPPCLIETLSMTDIQAEGCPVDALSYVELLLTSIADGHLSEEERDALADLAQASGLTAETVEAVHVALARAMAREAWEDGKVTQRERREVKDVLVMLGVSPDEAAKLLRSAEARRAAAKSADRLPLPPNWFHGEPLRVGDRVAVTGCAAVRLELERRIVDAGLRLGSGVTAKTALLISDGTVDGNKLADARLHGTRVVPPDDGLILVKYTQPQKTTPAQVGGRSPDNLQPAQIRRWAREQRLEVPTRGRLPLALVEAYLAAHPELRDE